jgi:CDP-diacylglycerol--glycerol-3-phosphate 3-phosphatidyltransferase
MLKRLFQALLYRLMQPGMQLLLKTGVRPNHLTLLGLLCNAVALWVFSRAEPGNPDSLYRAQWIGASWVLAGGLFDILDGRLARLGGYAAQSGAFFDSVLDRYAELLMFAGYGLLANAWGRTEVLVPIYAAAGASLMVSYTRARLEGLGGEGAVGLFQRPERLVLLNAAAIVGAILGLREAFGTGADADIRAWRWIMEPVLWVLAVGALFTALQRLWHGMRALSR